jgi:hypothetical protein
MAEASHRFPRLWRAEPIPGGHVVRDANGQALAYVYSRGNEAEARQAKVLTADEARRSALTSRDCPSCSARVSRRAERRGHDDERAPPKRGQVKGTNRHAGERPQPHGDIRKIYERFRRNPHTPSRRRRPQSVQIGIARLPELLGKASASEQWLR